MKPTRYQTLLKCLTIFESIQRASSLNCANQVPDQGLDGEFMAWRSYVDVIRGMLHEERYGKTEESKKTVL